MFNKISEHLKNIISNYKNDDSLIFNNKVLEINKNNFEAIEELKETKTLAFIDGGQAEIISAGNFCLSFIRVAATILKNNLKIDHIKQEFYLLTTARYENDDLLYKSKIFGDKIIDENDLLISSNDSSIRIGIERAPISKVSNMARRFAELSLAKQIQADFIILDGTLEATYKNEDKYLNLPINVCALAKSSSLFTTSGNSPIVLLNKLGLEKNWSYFIENNSYFVKLNPLSKHVFRFTGGKEVLPLLVENSKDALFLGYPYGLIAVDKFARVSNSEKNSLKMNFLLKEDNKEIAEYLSAMNAHQILDNLS